MFSKHFTTNAHKYHYVDNNIFKSIRLLHVSNLTGREEYIILV